MLWQNQINQIVNKVANNIGLTEGKPLSLEQTKRLIAESIYETVRSHEFIREITEKTAEEVRRTNQGYGLR